MAPLVEKKMAELEMGLLHLQQNMDITEITLPVHQTVAMVIKKCADFGDRVEDFDFPQSASERCQSLDQGDKT